jgi:hypothetical protein
MDLDTECCMLLRVPRLWNALARPVPASPSRIQALESPAVTLKLDGVRVLLLLGTGAASTLRAANQTAVVAVGLAAPPEAEPLTAVDCEERGGKLYALDALVVAGRDVRALPLEARLQRLAGALPVGVNIKPYEFLRTAVAGRSAVEALISKATDELERHANSADGLILVDAADPYWVPPLKFKLRLTCDFLLESSRGSDNYVLLVGSGGGGVTPWRERGSVARVSLPLKLTRQLQERLGARAVSRADAVVAECLRGEQGRFRVCALRPDRLRPNRAGVVVENVRLQEAGCHRPRWLASAVPEASPSRRFWRYVEACWRVLVVGAVEATRCSHVEVSLRDGCACAPSGLASLCDLTLGTSDGTALLSFLNLAEAHGSPEALAAVAAEEVRAVGALVLQPLQGYIRGLYHCEPAEEEGGYVLHIASRVAHRGKRLGLAGLEARAALLGFAQVPVHLPAPTDGLGVAGAAAAGLVDGLSAYLWVRPGPT